MRTKEQIEFNLQGLRAIVNNDSMPEVAKEKARNGVKVLEWVLS